MELNETLKFKCVTCGERMETHVETFERRGLCSECGDSDERVEIYSSQEAYAITAPTGEFEMLCRQPLEKLLALEKANLEAEIQKTVSREDFGKIILEQKLAQLGHEHKNKTRALHDLLRGFERDEYSRYNNGYAIHAKCIAPFLQPDKVDELKYVVDGGQKQLLRANLHVVARQIPEMLGYLVGQMSEFVRPDDFDVDEEFIFELKYLGE